MSTIVQQRRGTALEWYAANPILQAGQIGYEIDTDRIKIGNGISSWNSLDYSGGIAQHVKPSNPNTGEMWIDADSGKLYVYINNSWIET